MKENSEKKKADHLRLFWKSRAVEGGVTKVETGIKGLDELLEGGLPEKRVTLISGGPGCGKTVLLNDFLYKGATSYNEPGVFLTFEERPKDICNNLRNFGWEIDSLIADKAITILDAALPEEVEAKVGDVEWVTPILSRIEYMVKKTGARRLAVDNLGAAFLRYEAEHNNPRSRERLFRFSDGIKKLGVTTLVSSERAESSASLSRFGVEEFVCDGLIELDSYAGQGAEIRTVQVRKMRGCGYRSGKVIFEIGHDGPEIYPKIPVNTEIGETNFDIREEFGIAPLDRALGGGIPQGHILLVAGNTGTGKSTLALHFVKQGLAKSQPVVWVALEEPVRQVLKTASAHNWELEESVEKGGLAFVSSPLLDIKPDKLLYRVLDAINTTGAKRVVVDSISSLESASMSKEGVREFMIQLAGFAKTQGITVVLNYLSGDTFGAAGGQLLGSLTTNAMRLSSIVDGIIILRYVERDQNVQKLLNVLKLRGSSHVKDILRYEITREGFVLGKRFGTLD